MGKYFLGNETVRVSFEDGQWVDIKEELSQEDSDFIMNAMAKAEAGAETKVEFNLGRLALLEKSIVSWSFKDDKDNLVSVSRENISNLRVKYRTKVLSEIDRLNQSASEFAKN